MPAAVPGIRNVQCRQQEQAIRAKQRKRCVRADRWSFAKAGDQNTYVCVIQVFVSTNLQMHPCRTGKRLVSIARAQHPVRRVVCVDYSFTTWQAAIMLACDEDGRLTFDNPIPIGDLCECAEEL